MAWKRVFWMAAVAVAALLVVWFVVFVLLGVGAESDPTITDVPR